MIGKYRLVREVGKGATANVYLAEHEETKQRVALKVIKLNDDSSKLARRFRKLFTAECSVAQRMDHPNIVKVYDYAIEAERAYLAMEFIEGEGLDKYTAIDKLMPINRAVSVIFKVALALDYAARQGVVHRDVKPANIMIGPEPGDDVTVKLTDFGLALNTNKKIEIDSTFINGLGSPAYMSPEQIKGYQLNGQTDLYSLGVTLYQCLTGRLPFRAKTTASLVYKIINMDAAPVSQLATNVPKEADAILKRLLEKDLFSRYRNGGQLAKDLSSIRYQLLDDKAVVVDNANWKILRGLFLFNEFDDVEVWELLRISSFCDVPSDQALFKQGDGLSSFGVVLEGVAEIVRNGKVIATIEPGAMVGEMSYLDPEQSTASASVVARSALKYLDISIPALLFATEELKEKLDKLLTVTVVRRLRAANYRLERISVPAAPSKEASGFTPKSAGLSLALEEPRPGAIAAVVVAAAGAVGAATSVSLSAMGGSTPAPMRSASTSGQLSNMDGPSGVYSRMGTQGTPALATSQASGQFFLGKPDARAASGAPLPPANLVLQTTLAPGAPKSTREEAMSRAAAKIAAMSGSTATGSMQTLAATAGVAALAASAIALTKNGSAGVPPVALATFNALPSGVIDPQALNALHAARAGKTNKADEMSTGDMAAKLMSTTEMVDKFSATSDMSGVKEASGEVEEPLPEMLSTVDMASKFSTTTTSGLGDYVTVTDGEPSEPITPIDHDTVADMGRTVSMPGGFQNAAIAAQTTYAGGDLIPAMFPEIGATVPAPAPMPVEAFTRAASANNRFASSGPDSTEQFARKLVYDAARPSPFADDDQPTIDLRHQSRLDQGRRDQVARGQAGDSDEMPAEFLSTTAMVRKLMPSDDDHHDHDGHNHPPTEDQDLAHELEMQKTSIMPGGFQTIPSTEDDPTEPLMPELDISPKRR